MNSELEQGNKKTKIFIWAEIWRFCSKLFCVGFLHCSRSLFLTFIFLSHFLVIYLWLPSFLVFFLFFCISFSSSSCCYSFAPPCCLTPFPPIPPFFFFSYYHFLLLHLFPSFFPIFFSLFFHLKFFYSLLPSSSSSISQLAELCIQDMKGFK